MAQTIGILWGWNRREWDGHGGENLINTQSTRWLKFYTKLTLPHNIGFGFLATIPPLRYFIHSSISFQNVNAHIKSSF